MGRVIAIWCVVVAAGCGQPASPATASTPGAPAAGAPAPADQPPAVDDRAAVAQLALDSPQLQQYFHADQPGRVPVLVQVSPVIDPSWQLAKFDQPVQFVAADQVGGRAVVEFTRLEVTGDQARVDLKYDVEGVRAWITLARTDGHWRWVDGQITER